jgi:nucleoid-associated protein YgaU
MMRKDVKIGFAIGGVLVAVLVVYVLAVSGGKKDAGVQLVDGPTPVPAGAANAGAEHSAAAAQPTDPFKPTTPESSVASADHSASAPPPSIPPEKSEPKGSDEDRWMLALSRGTVPMMTTTPTSTTDNKSAAAADKPAVKSAASSVMSANATPDKSGRVEPLSSGTNPSEPDVTPVSMSSTTPPATQPAGHSSSSSSSSAKTVATVAPVPAAGARTHVVQPNETITRIAQAAYGNSNFWPHIVRANPSVNPNKMKPGTVLTLPPESEVKAGLASSSSSSSTDGKAESNTVTPMTVAHTDKPAAPLDPRTQYEVQPNDSLQRISTKLYGTMSKWQAIYDLNKATIGEDPGKVKVKMVLKLPEPPTVK